MQLSEQGMKQTYYTRILVKVVPFAHVVYHKEPPISLLLHQAFFLCAETRKP